MSWYKTGTINVTNGSNAVTGYNTKWTNPLIGVCSGQMLILQTQNTIEIYEIASIQSDTQLTLAKTYSGTSKTGITYEIPTSPKISIEALALRVSEMLNYYQIQLDAWQTILTGDGDVTLTAPNGQVVTIRSQLSISNELVKLAEQSRGFAQSARESADIAVNASTSASNSENTASSHAESARLSAIASANSAEQSRNSAVLAQQSENNAKQSEQNAAKSADDAMQLVQSIDVDNLVKKADICDFVKKNGEQQQSINGSLDAKKLTEQGQRVYSPNNKPSADDIGALSVTLNNEDGKKEIDSFLRFKKRPEFNNSDILTRDDYVGLLGENGYQKLPSGLIIQWGMANSPDRTGIVIPPIAFPNRVLSVHFTDTAGSVLGGAVPISWVLNSTSVNGFAWCATEPPGFFSFFAIGF
jgi:hypothetical protein